MKSLGGETGLNRSLLQPKDLNKSLLQPKDLNRSLLQPKDLNRSLLQPKDLNRSLLQPKESDYHMNYITSHPTSSVTDDRNCEPINDVHFHVSLCLINSNDHKNQFIPKKYWSC